MHVKKKKGWEIPERETTSEEAYQRRHQIIGRREFIRSATKWGLGAGFLLSGLGSLNSPPSYAGILDIFRESKDADKVKFVEIPKTPTSYLYPAIRNPKYMLDRPVTDEIVAATYNNFYEFSSQKAVWNKIEKLKARPWTIEITGLVEKPLTFDIDELVKKMPLEERLYRHRCVEAWAMAVPWTGFPMRALVRLSRPLSSARYIRLVTFHNPEVAFDQKLKFWLPWPYEEGLTMGEATNELTLIATGIYGHELPAQHGTPLRLVVPWKYGFKSIKSIVRIEFMERRSKTFWSTLVPDEYDFQANVDPEVPHPRWSQATERMIGTNERRPTIKYNGYGEYVAGLYA